MHIESNSLKRLVYDRNNIYEENYYTIYFVNTNTKELKKKLDVLDIEVLSYIVNDKEYYVRNIDKLEDKLLDNKSDYEKVYYSEHGINIDGINVVCQNNELIKLENIIDVY